MPAAYRPNRRGLEQLATSPRMQAVMHEVAEKAKTIAEGLAADFAETGEYAGSFEIQNTETVVNARFPHRAATARLRNTAGHAAAVEWGKEGRADRPTTSAHRTLGRALDEVGRA